MRPLNPARHLVAPWTPEQVRIVPKWMARPDTRKHFPTNQYGYMNRLHLNQMSRDHDARATAPDAAVPLANYVPIVLQRTRHDEVDRRAPARLPHCAGRDAPQACEATGITTRDRPIGCARPDARAFALAWDQALLISVNRLLTLAFERAARSTIREYWKNGELVAETRQPSEKLLTFLLQHLKEAGSARSRC